MLTVIALLLGQVATIGHYVLVAHYACAEHGTIHEGRASDAVREVSTHTRGPGVTAVPKAEHGSHDDCAFPARSHDLGGAPAAAVGVLVELDTTVLAPRADIERESRPIALVFLAPKQSPPISV
jgi:hypothetical protein